MIIKYLRGITAVLLLGLIAAAPLSTSAQCGAGETMVEIDLYHSGIGFSGPAEWSYSLKDAGGALIDTFTCGNFFIGDTIRTVCLDNAGHFVFRAYDSHGDGWTLGGGKYTITNLDNGCVISTGTPNNGIMPPIDPFSCADNDLEAEVFFDLTNIEGCTDPGSLNYDPCATVDNGTCEYPANNDLCVDALPLPVNLDGSCTVTYLGTNLGAGPDTSVIASIGCSDPDPYPSDIWFTLEMPASGEVDIDVIQTPGSSIQIDVYTGTCGSLVNSTSYICNYYFPFQTATITETAGQTVYLRVWDWGSDLFGTFELCAKDASPACSTVFPPVNLNSTVTATHVALGWDPVPQTVGCQINGRPIGTPSFASKIVSGLGASSTNIPLSILDPSTMYEWKVRCACTTVPIDATPFSVLNIFTTPALKAGLNTTHSDVEISLFPNPVSGTVNLKMESFKEDRVNLQIVDRLGRVMIDVNENLVIGTNTLAVSVGDLPNGIYTARISDLGVTKHFVIQH